MSDRPCPTEIADYSVFYSLESRWADNDIYGHINNVAYYAYFDSVVNRFLIERGDLNPAADQVVGYVVHSSANYFSPVSYPATLRLGLRVKRMGEKSLTWELGVFAPDADLACVTGSFTHAFVNRRTGESASIPAPIRAAVEQLA